MNKYIIVLLLLWSFSNCIGQGWERTLDAVLPGEQAHHIVQTADGGYLLAGSSSHTNFGDKQLLYVKVDARGEEQWRQNYSLFGREQIIDCKATPDGGYIATGVVRDIGGSLGNTFANAFLQKVDGLGLQEWIKLFYNTNMSGGYAVTNCIDSGFLMVGAISDNSNDIWLVKTNALGDTLWTKSYNDPFAEAPHSIESLPNGDFIIGAMNSISISDKHNFLMRIDSVGDTLWTKNYGLVSSLTQSGGLEVTPDGGFLLAGSNGNSAYVVKTDSLGNEQWNSSVGGSGLHQANSIALSSDSSYVVTGRSPSKLLLYKLNTAGQTIWEKQYGSFFSSNNRWKGYSVHCNTDGSIVAAGTKTNNSDVAKNIYIVKTDSTGELYSNRIVGYVYDDAIGNCSLDSSENKFQHRIVRAQKDSLIYWAVSNASGYFEIRVDTGIYDVILFQSIFNNYWQSASCSSDTIVSFAFTPYSIDSVNFPQEPAVFCPLMEVHVSTPLLRRCFTNYYTVQYCNKGTIDADSAWIDLTFDPHLELDTAALNLNWQQIGVNEYRFMLDTVAYNDCGSFVLPVYLGCDTTVQLGQTHCVVAQIYPDSLCAPVWAGPTIQLQVNCLGDSVQFLLNNVGSNMATPLSYYIYEDNVMVRPGSFQLNSNETVAVHIGTLNGATYRIEAQQALGFPALLGDTLIAIAIEGCQPDSNGLVSTGFVTQLPAFDAAPSIDIDCIENIGSYDPNDKTAQPKGYGPEHYIQDDVRLKYHIRFQNTGTDTAFYVSIVDTIAPQLDISTLIPGSSSHNYEMRIYGDNQQVVEFVFDNILLPDSTVNEVASHGFVQFEIEQKSNNPIGTIIENQAAIYFDFNAPVLTNTTFHEIGSDFVSIQITSSIVNMHSNDLQIKVFPNPFDQTATLTVEGLNDPYLYLEIYDLSGKRLQQYQANDNRIQLSRQQLNAGLYMYRLSGQNGLIGSGKIVVQ